MQTARQFRKEPASHAHDVVALSLQMQRNLLLQHRAVLVHDFHYHTITSKPRFFTRSTNAEFFTWSMLSPVMNEQYSSPDADVLKRSRSASFCRFWLSSCTPSFSSSNSSRHFFTRFLRITFRILFCCSISREMFSGRSSESTTPLMKFRSNGMRRGTNSSARKSSWPSTEKCFTARWSSQSLNSPYSSCEMSSALRVQIGFVLFSSSSSVYFTFTVFFFLSFLSSSSSASSSFGSSSFFSSFSSFFSSSASSSLTSFSRSFSTSSLIGYSSWSSLMCSTILVPRPSGSPLSGRTVNEPPADDSHTYCSSSLFFDVTTTLSATRYAE
uniref:Transmembrane protein n=1 Tax=Anopheles coluzzii TaxID=1518534 RepID=A0A8W7PGW2_ANOCL